MARFGEPDYLHFKWESQQNVYASKFHYLFEQEKFVDVTLSADGQFLKAHRIILCASSQYFEVIHTFHLNILCRFYSYKPLLCYRTFLCFVLSWTLYLSKSPLETLDLMILNF